MGIVDNTLVSQRVIVSSIVAYYSPQNNLVRREELKSELLEQFQIVGLNKITKVFGSLVCVRKH